jgi:hypothetical protein
MIVLWLLLLVLWAHGLYRLSHFRLLPSCFLIFTSNCAFQPHSCSVACVCACVYVCMSAHVSESSVYPCSTGCGLFYHASCMEAWFVHQVPFGKWRQDANSCFQYSHGKQVSTEQIPTPVVSLDPSHGFFGPCPRHFCHGCGFAAARADDLRCCVACPVAVPPAVVTEGLYVSSPLTASTSVADSAVLRCGRAAGSAAAVSDRFMICAHHDVSVQETYRRAHTRTRIHTHTHTNTYIHTYIHTYIQTYTHTYIHTFIHSYTQSYKHTRTILSLPPLHQTCSRAFVI